MILNSPGAGTSVGGGGSRIMGNLEKPKPVKVGGSFKNSKNYSIFTVSNVQNDNIPSAADQSATSKGRGSSRKAKTCIDNTGTSTMFPLLSDSSGYAAALMPEVAVGNTSHKQGKSNNMHLRFPILSPTREESMILSRMKTMQKAKKLTQSDPNLSNMTKASHGKWGRQSLEHHKIELEKVSPLPTRESKTRSVLTSQGGFLSTGRSSQATLKNEVTMHPHMKKEKTIIPSKHGYHQRSHSATYKRLDTVRKTLDELVEQQVVEFQDKIDLEDILEDMSNVDPYDYGSRLSPVDLNEGLPIVTSKSSQDLPFRIDRSVYELCDDATLNMSALYKEDTTTPKNKPTSGKSFGSKRSIDIVIPTGQEQSPDLHTKPYRSRMKQRGKSGSSDFKAALRLMRDDSEEERKKFKSKAPPKKKDIHNNMDMKGNRLEFLSDTSIASTSTTPRHAKARSRDHSQSPKLTKTPCDVSNLPDINVDFMKQKLLSIEAKQKSKIEDKRSKEKKERRKEELAKLLRTKPSITSPIGGNGNIPGRTPFNQMSGDFTKESWSEKYKRKNGDEMMYWDSGDDNPDDEFDI